MWLGDMMVEPEGGSDYEQILRLAIAKGLLPNASPFSGSLPLNKKGDSWIRPSSELIKEWLRTQRISGKPLGNKSWETTPVDQP